MNDTAAVKTLRRPRFRRAATAPAFRLTDDDIEIIAQLARHRFLRSTHIAALVGRSQDRVNDRLLRLFHTGYVDRPRAQLDRFPNSGTAPMVYALSDGGARLLTERSAPSLAVEWSRKNREAGRPFIEHQLEIMDFYVGLQIAVRERGELTILHADELVAAFPDQSFSASNPFTLQTRVHHRGAWFNVGLIPDLVFGLRFADGSRRCFMVEIDRGTMPVSRATMMQTSFDRKMRAYLAAYASRQHERHFGWKAFRVLTVTTDATRMATMQAALSQIHVPHSLGPALFFFAARDDLHCSDPLLHLWSDGNHRQVTLL